MPHEKKVMGPRKPFAIVRRSDNALVTMQAGEKAGDLDKLFPSSTFAIVEMTGKDELPKLREGEFVSDLTVNPSTGEWGSKLTDAALTERKKTRRASLIRSQLVNLHARKNSAVALGSEFAEEVASIQARISALEAELAGL